MSRSTLVASPCNKTDAMAHNTAQFGFPQIVLKLAFRYGISLSSGYLQEGTFIATRSVVYSLHAHIHYLNLIPTNSFMF